MKAVERACLGMDSRAQAAAFSTHPNRARGNESALAREGVKRIAVVSPGFAADCVETLEEIAVENKEIFLAHGGEAFSYIPCLNDSDEGIGVLVHLIERELEGWV